MDEQVSYYSRILKYISDGTLENIDSKQSDLTDKFLLPNLDLIETDVLKLREKFDIYISNLRKRNRRLGKKFHQESSLSKYPIGQCREIRDIVFSDIAKNSNNPNYPGLNILDTFHKKGGAVKGLWGVQKDKYFQNIIQAGNLTIDCANDTVDINKPKVEVLPIIDSQFRDINSFEDYANIVQKYWETDVFPNIYVPEIAPIFPLIFIKPDGRISFDGGDKTLNSRNILSLNVVDKTNFEMSKEFLFNSSYSNKRLSNNIENILARQIINRDWVSKTKNYWKFHHNGDEYLTRCAFYNFQDEFKDCDSPQELMKYYNIALGINDALKKNKGLIIPRQIFLDNCFSGSLLVPTEYYDIYN